MWPDILDEQGRTLGHAAGIATGAQTALAREGDEALEAAVGAPQAGKAAGEHPAVEIAAKGALDEARVGVGTGSQGLGEEGLEVRANDGVQRGLLGPAGTIAGRQGGRGGAGVAFVGDGRQRSGGRGRRRWQQW